MRDMIDSKSRKCLVTQYCHLPLQVRTSHTRNIMHRKSLSDINILFMERKRSNVIFPNNMTARNGNLTSHQKVCTRELTLNRKRKASEAQLSTWRINLLIETQHPTNLKQKLTHQEPATPFSDP